MSRAVIHIGSGKTGSTAIQRALFDASRKGGLRDFRYPTVKGWHHRDLYILFKSREALGRNLKSRIRSGQIDYDKYRKAYEKAFSVETVGGQDLILSSEYLFDFSPEKVRALRELLDRAGVTEYLVVAFVRHPASYYLSFVQQQLKASHLIPDPRRFRYRLKSALSVWSEVFGNVMVRDFDELARQGGDAVEAFAALVEEAGWGNLDLEPTRLNSGLCAEAMVLMQRYRRRFHSDADNLFKPDSDRLLAVVSELGARGSKPRLNDDVEVLVSNRHEDDIVYLQRHFGLFGNYQADSGSRSRIDWEAEKPVKVERLLDGLCEASVQDFSLSVLRELLVE